MRRQPTERERIFASRVSGGLTPRTHREPKVNNSPTRNNGRRAEIEDTRKASTPVGRCPASPTIGKGEWNPSERNPSETPRPSGPQKTTVSGRGRWGVGPRAPLAGNGAACGRQCSGSSAPDSPAPRPPPHPGVLGASPCDRPLAHVPGSITHLSVTHLTRRSQQLRRPATWTVGPQAVSDHGGMGKRWPHMIPAHDEQLSGGVEG